MVGWIRNWYRHRADEPWVRPWGLAAPVLVLVICLPLLRPLRLATVEPRGDAVALPVGLRLSDISDNELTRLATIQAVAEHKTLAINCTSFFPKDQPADRPRYSGQPPVLSTILAGPYWVMRRMGITFDNNFPLASYLLTLLGATLPVACAAGLVYRMARIFELRRPWRMLLAITTVFGSGLVSYATTLNTHAPGAALILAACSALIYGSTTRHPRQVPAWLALAGFCAALGAVVDLSAMVFLIALGAVVLALSWPLRRRLACSAWYVLGALPPLALHASLTIPIWGDLRPGFLHADTSGQVVWRAASGDEDEAPGRFAQAVGHLGDGTLGAHGLFSHFPILLLGFAGMAIVLRRHWPRPIKTMAVACLVAAAAIVLTYIILNPDWTQPMFAVRWFVVFAPMLIFWAGAWLRRQHQPATWATAGVLLAFSILTTLLGATNPFTPARSGEYTAYAAARQLIRPSVPVVRHSSVLGQAVSTPRQ